MIALPPARTCLFAAAVWAAASAAWFPAHSNDCGTYYLNSDADSDDYIQPHIPGKQYRATIMTLGLASVPITAGVTAISSSYGRATYAAFGLIWAGVLIAWESPCGHHTLGAGSYLALTSALFAVATELVS